MVASRIEGRVSYEPSDLGIWGAGLGLEATTMEAGVACVWTIWGICFVSPTETSEPSIFGFSEFLAALALLVLVYTSTDKLYRFRVSVAPLPIYKLTFVSTAIIGAGTLATDYWFAQRYPVPALLPSPNTIRTFLGALFLLVVMMWSLFAFISPPVFNRWNAKRFAQSIYIAILNGSDTELQIVGQELIYSLRSIVRHAPVFKRDRQEWLPRKITRTAAHAHDILGLIADKRFCCQVARTSPGTAIVLFTEATAQNKPDISLGRFYSNVTAEALLFKDSLIYHEDHILRTGLLGELKPFIKSAYGSFDLVEASATSYPSPFDIDYRVFQAFDPQQFEAFCRIVSVALHAYVAGAYREHPHSYALAQAISRISEGHYGIGQVDGHDPNRYSSHHLTKLGSASSFISDALEVIDKNPDFPIGQTRSRDKNLHQQKDLLDQLAGAAASLIFASCSARGDPDFLWQIHHNTVWGNIRSLGGGGRHSTAFRRRLFRIIYNEITDLEGMPNYKGAKFLGFALNILGFRDFGRKGYGHELYPLKRAVRAWTARHYMTLARVHPEVAAACIFGSISYDEENRRLVKTYAAGLSREPAREFLELAPARIGVVDPNGQNGFGELG